MSLCSEPKDVNLKTFLPKRSVAVSALVDGVIGKIVGVTQNEGSQELEHGSLNGLSILSLQASQNIKFKPFYLKLKDIKLIKKKQSSFANYVGLDEPQFDNAVVIMLGNANNNIVIDDLVQSIRTVWSCFLFLLN